MIMKNIYCVEKDIFMDKESIGYGYLSGCQKTNYEMVREFHEVYDCKIGEIGNPDLGTPALQDLRLSLIEEEIQELKDALAAKDIVEVADALGDALYVIYGYGVSIGLDMDAVVKEIHRSNLSKLDAEGKPIRREDGKILKGPNFFTPDLKSIIFKNTNSQ